MIEENRCCYICKNSTSCVEKHHVYFGTANRKISKDNGFEVDLCFKHHRGTSGVHGKNGLEINTRLKRKWQVDYEKTHTREEFMRLIGRNYL